MRCLYKWTRERAWLRLSLSVEQDEAMMHLGGQHNAPKLINGKLWVPDPVFGGYQRLPENDPKYKEILLWIDSQRFVELLDWVYNRNEHRASAGGKGQ
jgi:hypothetical protein